MLLGEFKAVCLGLFIEIFSVRLFFLFIFNFVFILADPPPPPTNGGEVSFQWVDHHHILYECILSKQAGR